MLADGDIPAMISPTLPKPFVEGDKRIARLFAGTETVEIAFFARDRNFPDHARDDIEAGDRRQIPLGRRPT